MDRRVIVLFLHFGSGLISCLNLHYEYYFVNLSLTWADSQHYCRTKYTDLATIENMDDISRLNRPDGITSVAWIGLNDDPQSWKVAMGNDSNSWRWSATGQTSRTGYSNWNLSQPLKRNANQFCGMMKNEWWFDGDCAQTKHFVCYNENATGQRTYTLFTMSKTWFEAQTYCRTHHTDLAMIENDQQQADVLDILVDVKNYVWFGLHRVPWRWSNGSNSSFKNWASGQPDNYDLNEHCVVENSDHSWVDYRCDIVLPFWCQGPQKKLTVVKMKMRSSADLSDPENNEQILQQLRENLRHAGITDAKLKWKSPPRKLEEDEEDDTNGTCTAQ